MGLCASRPPREAIPSQLLRTDATDLVFAGGTRSVTFAGVGHPPRFVQGSSELHLVLHDNSALYTVQVPFDALVVQRIPDDRAAAVMESVVGFDEASRTPQVGAQIQAEHAETLTVGPVTEGLAGLNRRVAEVQLECVDHGISEPGLFVPDGPYLRELQSREDDDCALVMSVHPCGVHRRWLVPRPWPDDSDDEQFVWPPADLAPFELVEKLAIDLMYIPPRCGCMRLYEACEHCHKNMGKPLSWDLDPSMQGMSTAEFYRQPFHQISGLGWLPPPSWTVYAWLDLRCSLRYQEWIANNVLRLDPL